MTDTPTTARGVRPDPPRTCVLVGDGNLLIQSGQLLRDAGLLIGGVISDDPSVVRWAGALGLRTTGHGPELIDWLHRLPHDYLFSIFNLRILAPEVIRAPRIAALNYHDALLPRYAGLHATSWALINGEKTHGITWHLMDAGIDTGAIVTQRAFDVARDDTALSMNLKCSAAALAALADLIPDLARGSIASARQDVTGRTYFSASRRPAAGGIIDWRCTAEDIDALIRGCDFGSYFNPLVLPKIWTGTEYLVATTVTGVDGSDGAPPGVILAVADGELTIATGSRPVAVSGLMTIDGEPLSSAEAAERYRLAVGCLLPSPTAGRATQVLASTEVLSRHERFWERRLQSLLPISPLRRSRFPGTDAPREPVRHLWRLPDEVDAWLASGARRWRREEFLLAALGVFLERLSFHDVFDVELEGHGVGHHDPLLFATRVPFRFHIGDDLDLIMDAVRVELDHVARHHTYPRDLIPRSPSLRSRPDMRRRAKLPVAVVLGSADAGVRSGQLLISLPLDGAEGVIEGDRRLFEDIPALAERLPDFLRDLVVHKGALSRVSLTNPAERAVLAGWGSGGDAGESVECLHHLIEAQAARTPNAVAVRCGADDLTYSELDAAADRLAVSLRRRGAGPEAFVGICLERSPELVVGLLGILKAGAAYVPLDPAYPSTRLEFIINDAGLCAIVTARRHADRLPRGQTPLMCLDADEEQEDSDDPPGGRVVVTNRGCAYLIYTSGSTGEPKGVQVEHRSVVNFVRAAGARYRLGPGDRILQFASISFDASVEEIFPCLASGATLVLRTDSMICSATEFISQCAEFGITVIDLPTAYWRTLVAHLPRDGTAACPSLRLAIIGGETADAESVRQWRSLMGERIELINTYGSTETTVVSTWTDIGGHPDSGDVPIGIPIPGATAQVLDRHGQLVPVGVPGQLHIGGAVVARGYHNRPELTADTFIPDPSGMPGVRLCKTGDLCSWRGDGMLEFHGRIDDQVKVRGYRIELGEIESVLEAHPDVAQAAVVACDADDRRDTLRACIVPRSAGDVDRRELRQNLVARLPAWMVPAEWLILDELPLSANGKVDRRVLAQGILASRDDSDVDGPRTLLEMEILRIWRSLFGRQDIGPDDDFFEMGGHSLLAVQFVDQLEHLLGHRLPITMLFQTPTVALLVRALSNESWLPEWTSLVPLQPAGTRCPLFLMHGMTGLTLHYWQFARLLSPDQPVYGLQGVGSDGSAPRHRTLADMAAHYLREIRSSQPVGPYQLGGYSLGGWIAYEVASQLRAAGQEVTLFILDTHPFCVVPWSARGAYALTKVVAAIGMSGEHLSNLSALGFRGRLVYVAKRIMWFVRGLFRPPAGPLPIPENVVSVAAMAGEAPEMDYYSAVAERHCVGVIDGRVELFLAREPLVPRPIQIAQTLFWRSLVRDQVRVHLLPCPHRDIFTDGHIKEVAEIVDRVLAERSSESQPAYTS